MKYDISKTEYKSVIHHQKFVCLNLSKKFKILLPLLLSKGLGKIRRIIFIISLKRREQDSIGRLIVYVTSPNREMSSYLNSWIMSFSRSQFHSLHVEDFFHRLFTESPSKPIFHPGVSSVARDETNESLSVSIFCGNVTKEVSPAKILSKL